MKHVKLLAVFLIPVVALILGTAASESWAAPLDEAEVLIEINAFDEDAGFQAAVDGEAWESLEIEAPNGIILNVLASGSLELTELVFEGNEPTIDERTFEQLLEAFPEGNYRFRGVTVDGKVLNGNARLTHVFPCGPDIVVVVNDDDSVTVSWDPVTSVINPVATDEAGIIVCVPAPSLRMRGYQVVAEEGDRDYSVDLPADATSWTVPAEFFQFGDAKIEVLGTEVSGNRTSFEEEL
jgi:hypothetical protein